MLDTLDHLVIAVGDLPAATARFTSLLGRRPSWKGEHPSEGTENVLYRIDNTYVELLAATGEGATAAMVEARLASHGEGLVALAFGTADADACHAAFEKASLAPAPVRDGLGRDVESGAFRQWRNVILPPAKTRGVLLFAIEHQSPADILPVADELCDPDAAIRGVDHVVVNTRDADAAKALYGDALGIRLALDKSFEQWGARLLFFRVGGITVEIASRLEGGSSEAPPALEGDEDSLFGISWRVADAEAARERLAKEGFDVSEVRDGRKPGTRVFTIRDEPLGVAMLALQPAPKAA